MNYSVEASGMRDWDDTCDVVLAGEAVSTFNISSPEFRSGTTTHEPPRLKCISFLYAEDGPPVGDFTVWISVLDSNTEAAEAYADQRPLINELLHGHYEVEPDLTVDLGENSSWRRGQVVAYEEPTVVSTQRKGAYAVVQGDFFVLMTYFQFDPETALRAGCQPDSDDDCLLTATELAEFMADDYLNAVYDSIETRLNQ